MTLQEWRRPRDVTQFSLPLQCDTLVTSTCHVLLKHPHSHRLDTLGERSGTTKTKITVGMQCNHVTCQENVRKAVKAQKRK